MTYDIKKVGVLGAGVMGATIAAHFTNAGIECYLLDIVPFELTEADKKKGLTEQSPAWRNRFAQNGLDGALKSKPSAFLTKKNASMIKIGNFTDNLDWLADVDLVVEVVVENLKIKQDLFAKVEKIVKDSCIVTTNTSGIPIKDVSANLKPEIKERFLGVHFFNPPRYMKLLEIIPGEKTKKAVIDFMVNFSESVLGKGVVVCKDRPNFIGNRIGSFDMANASQVMLSKGLKIEELDAIISKPLGRPSSAIFGTIDLVGLDTGYHVSKNLYDAVPDDEMREYFKPGELTMKMLENKWLGNKTGQGYYKRTKDEKGKKVKLVLDYKTMDYVVPTKPVFESIEAAKKTPGGFAAKLKVLFNGTDVAAEVAREYLCRNFIYAANRVPEICNTIVGVDNAMKWGYNHEMGPFETWDAVGVAETVEAMKKLKLKVPKKIEDMLKTKHKSFYVKKKDGTYYYDFSKKTYVKMAENPKIILLPSLKERKKIVKSNQAASLVDIGDGVVCLEFHTKMNAIEPDLTQMIFESCDVVEKDFAGMVVANHATNFSVGANILFVLDAAQKKQWDLIGKGIEDLQNANMRMKYLSKPVVTTPAGMALGGGCEMAIHGAKCQPHCETYIGLVEVGVGVIPAGGGVKELMVRCTEGLPDGVVDDGMNLQQIYAKVFQNIAMAKVSTSAAEGMELGYIRKTENISLSRDQHIWDAKQTLLGLARYYRKPRPAMIPVMGENFRGMIDAALYGMKRGNYVSDYDVHVSRKVAYIISGGDCPEGTWVTEQDILDLEKEAFISLMGEAKTHERIIHMLNTGKPLRN